MEIKSNKIILILLIVAAATSVAFLFVVESFNDISLDDVGFALILQKNSVWGYMMDMYFTWQGRFMGFLLNGIQMKSYFLFGNMMPFTILMYVLNILLVSKALVNFFKIKIFESILYAIILFQLYVYSMFDLSSYFWMCTKGYSFLMSLSLFAFSELMINKQNKWLNYMVLFVTFAFLGCSYEIYAPIILLFMGSVLLYKFYKAKYSIKQTITDNQRLVFSFVVCLVFFTLMVIAPGNWVRMGVHAKDAKLGLSDFLVVVLSNTGQLMKSLFFKLHYFVVAAVLMVTLIQKSTLIKDSPNVKTDIDILKKVLFYAFVFFGLIVVSLVLNTYVLGSRMEIRAFNHINLLFFIFIGFTLYQLSQYTFISKSKMVVLPITLVFIIVCNLYATIKSIPELQAYKSSVDLRMQKLNSLQQQGNTKTIQLEQLNAAEYHSIDDLWKIVIPKFSSRLLLKPNDVSNGGSMGNFYNKTYREYYGFDFDVVTDLSYELH